MYCGYILTICKTNSDARVFEETPILLMLVRGTGCVRLQTERDREEQTQRTTGAEDEDGSVVGWHRTEQRIRDLIRIAAKQQHITQRRSKEGQKRCV